MDAEERLVACLVRWHCGAVNPLRDLRRAANLGQRELADLLAVPLETLRTWDSGRRPMPSDILQRAETAVREHQRRHQLLSLRELAIALGVHIRTLQAGARTGRLETHFSTRSSFGHPIRRASIAAGQQFLADHYRRFRGQAKCPAPLPQVPADFHEQLQVLRRRHGLSQNALARRIGAAGKAVIYQWESRRRTPSPVFWQRLVELKSAHRPGVGLRNRSPQR